MKKYIAIAALIFAASLVSFAQPRAIGLRIGHGAEISYQHTTGSPNFVEADLGWSAGGLRATAIYDFVIGQYNWTPGTWTWYAGPGATLGLYKDCFTVGIAGQMGLEYKFEKVPISLAADVRPQIGFIFGGESLVFNDFLGIFCPFLSVKYAF